MYDICTLLQLEWGLEFWIRMFQNHVLVYLAVLVYSRAIHDANTITAASFVLWGAIRFYMEYKYLIKYWLIRSFWNYLYLHAFVYLAIYSIIDAVESAATFVIPHAINGLVSTASATFWPMTTHVAPEEKDPYTHQALSNRIALTQASCLWPTVTHVVLEDKDLKKVAPMQLSCNQEEMPGYENTSEMWWRISMLLESALSASNFFFGITFILVFQFWPTTPNVPTMVASEVEDPWKSCQVLPALDQKKEPKCPAPSASPKLISAKSRSHSHGQYWTVSPAARTVPKLEGPEQAIQVQQKELPKSNFLSAKLASTASASKSSYHIAMPPEPRLVSTTLARSSSEGRKEEHLKREQTESPNGEDKECHDCEAKEKFNREVW
ncbi:hypothetical protein CPB97_001413, partial [Podila verticillata]